MFARAEAALRRVVMQQALVAEEVVAALVVAAVAVVGMMRRRRNSARIARWYLSADSLVWSELSARLCLRNGKKIPTCLFQLINSSVNRNPAKKI